MTHKDILNELRGEDDYLDEAWLSYHIKKGNLKQLRGNHSDPALYGLDKEWVEGAKKRYNTYLKKEYEDKLQKLYRERFEWTDMLRERIRGGRDHSFIDRELERIEKEIIATKKRLSFLSVPFKNRRTIDIARAKAIPIDSIYEVLPNGFFVHNPLREERSPSNSMHLNRNTNKWNDYATGEYGDLLDLVMKQYDCDLITAYNKILTCV